MFLGMVVVGEGREGDLGIRSRTAKNKRARERERERGLTVACTRG